MSGVFFKAAPAEAVLRYLHRGRAMGGASFCAWQPAGLAAEKADDARAVRRARGAHMEDKLF